MGILPEALEPAEERGLITVSGGEVRFRPPTVAAALYHGASFVRRRDAHLALASSTLDAERRIWHVCVSAMGPDESAAQAAETAAELVGKPNNSKAVWFRVRAAELSEGPEDRVRRFILAARTAWARGDRWWAHSILERAARIATDVEARASVAYLLGRIEARAGDPRVAYELLRASAQELAPVAPSIANDLFACAYEAALLFGRSGVIPSQPRGLEQGAVWSGHMVLESGEIEQAPSHLPSQPSMQTMASGRWLAAPEREAVNAEFVSHSRLMGLGDLGAPESLDGARRLVLFLRAIEHKGELPLALAALGFHEYQAGLLTEARANATEARTRAADTGQDFANAMGLATLAFISAAEGKEEELAAIRDEARSFDCGKEVLALVLKNFPWAQGLSDLAGGRMSEALERLNCLAGSGRSPSHHALWSAPDLIEAAAHCRRPDIAREALSRYATWVESARLPWMRALLARCRALISRAPRTEPFFRQALALHPPEAQPLERARTMLLLGEYLRRTRRVGEARAELRAARGIFLEFGADAWVERAELGLKGSGISRKRDQLATAASLTAREQQVAELAAGGHSNRVIAERLFISPRTVAYHLQLIYRKLDIRSRAALSGALAQVTEPDEVGTRAARL